MVQSPSWEANWFAASQIPRISRNPKVHYRTHKRPPPVSILGQPNPVHIPTSHLLQIQPNIIHPSTPRSLQWSPSLKKIFTGRAEPIRAIRITSVPISGVLLYFQMNTASDNHVTIFAGDMRFGLVAIGLKGGYSAQSGKCRFRFSPTTMRLVSTASL